ncbi:MAG: thiamine pyrophosphate-dependent dehydrogenase E1 component subunit alpha [Thermodesulfobacteriota bacterium]
MVERKDVELKLNMYRTMLKIRSFEERVAKLFADGEIPGFLHLALGQEAVATGLCAALAPEDYITSTHRGHAHAIAKGVRTDRFMAELMGKADGYCQGKGGSIHLADRSLNHLGSNGIVAGGIPLATGAAFSAQYRESRQVAVCFFGDGAVNEGAFHECLNLAALWQLPVVYCCENNGWAEYSAQSSQTRAVNVAERARIYGLEGVRIEAHDPYVIYQEAKPLIERARDGRGPALIECLTCRWRGHHEGDAQKYRPKEDLDAACNVDCLALFEERLRVEETAEQTTLDQIRREVAEEIEAAVAFARQSPLPGPEIALKDVYKEVEA